MNSPALNDLQLLAKRLKEQLPDVRANVFPSTDAEEFFFLERDHVWFLNVYTKNSDTIIVDWKSDRGFTCSMFSHFEPHHGLTDRLKQLCQTVDEALAAVKHFLTY